MFILMVMGFIEGSWDRAMAIHNETADFIKYMVERSKVRNPIATGFSINSRIVGEELLAIAQRNHEKSGIGALIFGDMSGEPVDTLVLDAPPGEGAYCPNSIIHECWTCPCCGTANTVCVLLYVTGDGMCIYRCYPCPARPVDCYDVGETGNSGCEGGRIYMKKAVKQQSMNWQEARDVEVYDESGRLVYRGRNPGNLQEFLKNRGYRGVFIVKWRSGNRELSRKILVH